MKAEYLNMLNRTELQIMSHISASQQYSSTTQHGQYTSDAKQQAVQRVLELERSRNWAESELGRLELEYETARKEAEQQGVVFAASKINCWGESESGGFGWLAARPKTIDDVILVHEDANRTKTIWDSENQMSVRWSPKGNAPRCREILLMRAEKLIKVIYFFDRVADIETITKYIPERMYKQVFSANDWTTKIKAMVRITNERVVSKSVFGCIVPRWEEHRGFPEKPFDRETSNIQEHSPHFQFFLTRAREDLKALDKFMEYSGECIDWARIKKQSTKTDTQSYIWAAYSLAVAVDILYRIGLTNPERKKSDVPTGKEKLRLWRADAASDQARRLRPELNQIPLRYDFGIGGKKSRRCTADKPTNGDTLELAHTPLPPTPGAPAVYRSPGVPPYSTYTLAGNDDDNDGMGYRGRHDRGADIQQYPWAYESNIYRGGPM